jgi:hypothetical protein
MRGRSAWISVAFLAAMGCLMAGCGGGGSGDGGNAEAAAAKEKGKKARKLALIDISVADFDGVAVNEIIKFEFTEILQPDSVRPDTIQIREGPNYGKQVPGEFRIDGDIVWFYPTLPTKPAVAGATGEVIYAGLKPGTTYQITLPGAPKVAVVRNFADSPLRKQWRERFRTAAAGSSLLYVDNFLDPLPAKIRFCNPPSGSTNVDSDMEILLTFTRRPLNPATVSRNTVRLTMMSRHGESNLRSVPGEPVLDQSYDRVLIRFTPDFPLADDATYRLTAERLEDLVGNDVEYFTATFSVRDEPVRYSHFSLTFNEYQKDSYMDDSETTASWNGTKTDALSALFTAAGGSGRSGDLTPSAGVNLQFNAQTTPGVDVVTEDGVTYDVFNFRRINIPTNTTVSFVQRPSGPNRPIKVLALFPIEIDGVLSVRGGIGGDCETYYTSTTLPTNPGGKAGPGGGDGAAAFSGSPGSVPGSSSDRAARTMDAPDVPYGGFGGKGGLESGNTYYCFAGGAGGGGGRTDGAPGQDGSNSYTTGAGGFKGAGGLGRNVNFARQPNVGGAGGGAGGMGYYLGYPGYQGAGSGGGGGGAITLQAAGSIHVSGSILASGGNGGSMKGYFFFYGGCGGGGAGGSIRIATTSNANVDSNAVLDVSGGLGGTFQSTYTYYAGGNAGNGGEGFLCVAVPDRSNAVVSGTAKLTYVPPYYDTTFAPAGGGLPSVGQTTWINLGVFDPEMIEFNAGSDLLAESYNDSITFYVQMVIEDTSNIGNPDLSALDLGDADGDGEYDDSTDLSVMSDWVSIEAIETLNGHKYQFVRIRASFQLDASQTFDSFLPYVDELILRFKY